MVLYLSTGQCVDCKCQSFKSSMVSAYAECKFRLKHATNIIILFHYCRLEWSFIQALFRALLRVEAKYLLVINTVRNIVIVVLNCCKIMNARGKSRRPF